MSTLESMARPSDSSMPAFTQRRLVEADHDARLVVERLVGAADAELGGEGRVPSEKPKKWPLSRVKP